MKTQLLFLSLLFAGFASINAQTTMNIYQSNGTVLQIPISSIDSITYTVSNPGNLATITTLPIGNTTSNSASTGGSISATGGSAVTQFGVCWSTLQNPTTARILSLLLILKITSYIAMIHRTTIIFIFF